MPYSGNRLTPEGSSFLAGHGNHYKNTRSPLVVLENLPQFWDIKTAIRILAAS